MKMPPTLSKLKREKTFSVTAHMLRLFSILLPACPFHLPSLVSVCSRNMLILHTLYIMQHDMLEAWEKE
jgi:hypothetical protein